MTYQLDNKVVNVFINVENYVLTPDAFSSVGFITRSDNTPRTVVVNKLEDLVDAGFTRDSVAYNFCYGVFLQRNLNNIIVRSVREGESYLDAYKADTNNSYYYLVIESKNISDILLIQGYLTSNDQLKLMFFSSGQDYSKEVAGLDRLVYYYNDNLNEDIAEEFLLLLDSGDYMSLDSSDLVSLDV